MVRTIQYEDPNKNGIGKKGLRELKGDENGITVVPKNESGVAQSAGTVADPMHTVQIGKVCIASITETDLTDNVYTVTGDPATRIELINDGAGELTITVSDGANTISKVLKPDDVYDQDFTAITTVTFSAGAVFRADILR
jgi:hypothetical protein